MRLKHVAVGMGIVWLWTIAGGGGSVYGQTAPASGSGQESSFRLGKDLSLTIGLDLWVNQWAKSAVPSEDYFFPVGGTISIDSGDNVTQLSAWGVGIIPNVTLTYQNFFLSSSYMWTPEYDFGRFSDILSIHQKDRDIAATHESSQTASRQEVDFTAGYFPLDWLGVAIGYKGIFLDFEQKAGSLRSQGFTPFELFGLQATYSYHGPIFGVLASAKIDERFSLLGNAFGGYLFAACDFDLVGTKDEPRKCSVDNSPYVASKIVMRYVLTPQIAATFGYRIQIINNPNDRSSTAIDLTHGPVFGVNYRF